MSNLFIKVSTWRGMDQQFGKCRRGLTNDNTKLIIGYGNKQLLSFYSIKMVT